MHELTLQTEESTGMSGNNRPETNNPGIARPGANRPGASKPGVWPWVIGAAALLALVSSVNSDMRNIRSTLVKNSAAIVENHTSNLNKSNIDIAVNGRDLTLTGKIQSEANREQLVADLRALEGVRVVEDAMDEYDPRKQEKNDRLAFKQAIEQLDTSTIKFNPNSAALSSGSNIAIGQVAAMLRDAPQRQIKITGHTDNSGNAQVNLKISKQRAQSVADSLLLNGVNEEQLIVQGFGHTRPLYSNDTEAGRSRNRRIEFVFMK